jgi:hypothetical protein
MKKVFASLMLILLVACAAKVTQDYISAIPEPLDVSKFVKAGVEQPQFVVEMDQSCDWEKMAIPGGVLTTSTGERITLKAGVLISICKAEQLIRYKSAAETFYSERNAISIAYNAQYKGCQQIEKLLQDKIEDCQMPSVWEQVDFEAGYALGAGTCIGIVYGIAPALKDK